MTKRCLLTCSLLAMLLICGRNAPARAEAMPLLAVPDATKLGYAITWSSGLDVNPRRGDSLAYATVLGDALVTVEWPANLVTVVSLKDGSVRWRQAMGGKLDRILGVASAGKDEWIVCSDVRLYGVSPDDGHVISMVDLDCTASAMGVVVGNLAIIPGVNGKLFTEDLTTGNPLWAYQLRSVISIMPLVTKNGVVAADNSGNAILIDPERGQLQWANRTFAAIKAMPAVNGHSVFVPSTDNSLYAWDLRTGQDQWVFHAGERLTQPPLAQGAQVLVSLPSSKQLVALNAATGAEAWRIDAAVQAMVPMKAGLLLALPRSLQLIEAKTGKSLEAAPVADALQYVLTGPDASVILVTPRGRMARLDPLP